MEHGPRPVSHRLHGERGAVVQKLQRGGKTPNAQEHGGKGDGEGGRRRVAARAGVHEDPAQPGGKDLEQDQGYGGNDHPVLPRGGQHVARSIDTPGFLTFEIYDVAPCIRPLQK